MIDIVNGINQYQGSFYNIDNSGLLQARKEVILYDNEQNQIAQKAATELASAIGNLKFHNSMAAEKQKLTSDLDNMINNTLQNYAGSLRYSINNIMQMSRDLVTDEKIKGLLETNKQYEEWVTAVKENKYIDEDTKEFILNNPDNQYHFDATVINDDGTQSVINGWRPGNNDNIIGYKNWQAGREPVTQRNYLEFAVNVLKTLDTDNNQYTVRKFYDVNHNELKNEDILNAAYYVDNGNTKVVLTEQKIKDAIENAINSDLSIQASLRQDYDKARYFRDKGDDRYGVGVGTNSVLSPEGYKNKIFSGFASTYGIDNTVWSTVPSIITDKNSKDSNGTKSNKVTPVDNWSASVGIIEQEYNPSQVAEQYRTDIKAIDDDFLKVISKYNIPVNIQAMDQLSTNTQINIIKNNKDKITDDNIYVGMINALQRKLDYQERLTLYDQDIFNKLPIEQQALIKKYEALNNGSYLNFEEDSPFITYYNNFFKNSNGDVLNTQVVNFNDKEISDAIINLANRKGINLNNCGIVYDVTKDEFAINNDPLAFKVLSELTYHGLNSTKGVTGKYLYLGLGSVTDPNKEQIPMLTSNNRVSLSGYSPNITNINQLIQFGSDYEKLRQQQQDIKKEAGIEVNKEHLDTHHLYDIGYTLLERSGANSEQLNEYMRNLRDEITKLDYTQYEVYVSDNMEIGGEYVYNFSDKGRENRKRKDERDGSLRLINDKNKLKELQKAVELALNNKTTDNNKSVNVDYAPNSYNNIQIGFSDVANVGVGNYIKVPYGNEVYTVFIKTNKGVNGTEGGLNDYQRAYIQSPEYIYKREIDELSLGDNPLPRTLDIGTTNTYKMGYVKTNDGYGNYYVKYEDNITNLSKEEMISLIGIREDFKDLARQVRFLPDDVERELKRAATSESFDGNMTLLQPYSELINNIGAFAAAYAKTLSILSNNNEITVTRNIINDILNYY